RMSPNFAASISRVTVTSRIPPQPARNHEAIGYFPTRAWSSMNAASTSYEGTTEPNAGSRGSAPGTLQHHGHHHALATPAHGGGRLAGQAWGVPRVRPGTPGRPRGAA